VSLPTTKAIDAHFDDPKTTATYFGEAVGTHYSVALRAAEAYGQHLAAARGSLLQEVFEGDGLTKFWQTLLNTEQVRNLAPGVLQALGTRPDHYFRDFLDTAEEVYERRYEDVSPSQRKRAGRSEHAKCLRLLRDHEAEGLKHRFAVQNRVATWMQVSRITRAYRQ